MCVCPQNSIHHSKRLHSVDLTQFLPSDTMRAWYILWRCKCLLSQASVYQNKQTFHHANNATWLSKETLAFRSQSSWRNSNGIIPNRSIKYTHTENHTRYTQSFYKGKKKYALSISATLAVTLNTTNHPHF